MRTAKIEDLHCNAGWRDFSFLKITADDGTVAWSEFMENFGAERLSGVIGRPGERPIDNRGDLDPRVRKGYFLSVTSPVHPPAWARPENQ